MRRGFTPRRDDIRALLERGFAGQGAASSSGVKRMMNLKRADARGAVLRAMSVVSVSVLLAACGSAAPALSTEDVSDDSLGQVSEALTGEDGLAEAYALFKQSFIGFNFDKQLNMGVGYHPGLSTEKLPATTGGQPPGGNVFFDFTTQKLNATIQGVPAGAQFDLWFVKNVAGSGRTFKPETGDTLLKIGAFAAPGENSRCFGQLNCLSIDDLALGQNIDFDLDLVVITRKDKSPTASRIAVGARTVFEKRFFREKKGQALDAVTGTQANNVETKDALVARGAQLFFNETFGGNGRTCGTCHRAENNLTIDPAFIATLPQSDALFVAENVPALSQLEDHALLRNRALIRENVDGFEDPTHKFVERSVNHTFAMALTNDISAGGFGSFPFAPPDQRTGWGGDGAPGRGTMHEFAFGAVVQHFTKDLARRPGVDFRIPTQEELDALEAFQFFTGRQKLLVASRLVLRDSRAAHGRQLFEGGQGGCTACHGDLNQSIFNSSFDTGVKGLTPDLPNDDAFLDGTFGFGFNVPPLIEAADTAPLFHNNAVADIESAVAFYTSDTFRQSPVGRFFFINLNSTEQADVAAFLRVMNAAENVRQVRKRAEFVKNNRGAGNSDILRVAIADTQDAIDVLGEKGLNPTAVNELFDVRQTLQIALANPDANRVPYMDHAITYLNLVKTELFSENPDNQF
jgi:mono/diheme cytochrome c family protein